MSSKSPKNAVQTEGLFASPGIMEWKQKLVEGKFLKRYKRFFADVVVDGETVVAHVANTGSLKSCLQEGTRALLSPATNPERKLRFSLEALESPHKTWVGVNTSWPNSLVKEAFEQGLISDWKKFDEIKMEHKISKETRLDGVLLKQGKPARFFEVKNVTLARGDYAGGRGVAQFPDAVTERGQKHLKELIKIVEDGFEAEIIFVIQRLDCIQFSPAADIDPDYAELLKRAQKAGVTLRLLVVRVGLDGLAVETSHKISLKL